MEYAVSIGILIVLVIGVFVVFASLAVILQRVRIRYYRAKFPDMLLETLIPTGLWDVARKADGRSLLLLNWGKSKTLNLNDVSGYKVRLQRKVRFSPNSAGFTEEFDGEVVLETKSDGTITVFVGDGETATEIGVALKSIGICFLDQSTEIIETV